MEGDTDMTWKFLQNRDTAIFFAMYTRTRVILHFWPNTFEVKDNLFW